MQTGSTRRLLAWASVAASLLATLPACTLLLDADPVQCRDNASCARFSNAVCDVGRGVCVPRPPLPDGNLPIGTADGDGGGDLVLSDAGKPMVDGGTDVDLDAGSTGSRDVAPNDLHDDASMIAQNHANGGCPDRDHDGVTDCLQGLLVNPDFGIDATRWTPEAGVMQTAPGNAAADNPAAGALAVVNTNWASMDGSTMAGATQCVAIQPSSWYGIYAEVQVPSDQDPLTSAGLALLSFATPDCSGSPTSLLSPVLVGAAKGTATWTEIQASFPTLANTASVSARLVVLKAFQQAPARALFDNVLLRAQ